MRAPRKIFAVALASLLAMAAVAAGVLELAYAQALSLAPRPPAAEALPVLPDLVAKTVWGAEFGAADRRIFPVTPVARLFFLPPSANSLPNMAARLSRSTVPRATGWRWHLAIAAREIWFSRHYTADQIISFGATTLSYHPRFSDINSAAQQLYGEPLDTLGPSEVALLVGMARAPVRYDPWCNPSNALARRAFLLTRLADAGAIPRERLAGLLARPLGIRPAPTEHRCSP